MTMTIGSDEEDVNEPIVCVDVEEALYLLTKRHVVIYDNEALEWKCTIPPNSSIDTRFAKATFLSLRSHDGTLICSHASGAIYLVGINIVQTRKGNFVDSKMLLQNTAFCEEDFTDEKASNPHLERIQDLDLRGSLVDLDIMTQLSQGIATDRYITTLLLSGNHLKDAEMILLASALAHNNCLREVSLSYNAIGEIGSASLAKALASNSCLQSLDLMHNQIGRDGILPWLGDTMRVNQALRVLKLSHNAIGDKKIVDLFQSLSPKPLTEEERLKARLAKRQNHAIIFDGSEDLDGDSELFNSTLETLLLSNTGISNDVTTHLAHVLSHTRSLTHLDISCNDFTSQGNANIARGLHHNASTRYLNYCEIKLDEIAALAILQALTLHPLVETALFQGCFQGFRTEGHALAQLVTNTRSLVLLDLSYCRLDALGAIEFYSALADNPSLRSLDLTCSGLKTDSAVGILATSLQRNTTLTFVNLSYNEITLRGCKLLRDAIAGRNETAAQVAVSLEGNAGEKCPTGPIISGGIRPISTKKANCRDKGSLSHRTEPRDTTK